MNNSKELPLHRVSSWQIYYNELNSSSFLLEPKWHLGADINEVGSAPRENYVNDKSLLLKDVKKQNMSGGSVAVPSVYAFCCQSASSGSKIQHLFNFPYSIINAVWEKCIGNAYKRCSWELRYTFYVKKKQKPQKVLIRHCLSQRGLSSSAPPWGNLATWLYFSAPTSL